MAAVDPVVWARALGVGSMGDLVGELHGLSASVAEAIHTTQAACQQIASLPESEIEDHLSAGLHALEDAASSLSAIQGVLGGWA